MQEQDYAVHSETQSLRIVLSSIVAVAESIAAGGGVNARGRRQRRRASQWLCCSVWLKLRCKTRRDSSWQCFLLIFHLSPEFSDCILNRPRFILNAAPRLPYKSALGEEEEEEFTDAKFSQLF
jgi:hypothetical protein